MTGLEDYHQKIREAILRRNGEPILNGTVDHAALITQESFNSGHHIRLVSSRLDPSCYLQPGVIAALRSFLANKSNRIEILVEAEDVDWSRHPLIMSLGETKKQIELYQVPSTQADRYTFNFLLMDDYGFRYEVDRRYPAAVAAFLPPDADKSRIKNLDKIFSEIRNASTRVKLS